MQESELHHSLRIGDRVGDLRRNNSVLRGVIFVETVMLFLLALALAFLGWSRCS